MEGEVEHILKGILERIYIKEQITMHEDSRNDLEFSTSLQNNQKYVDVNNNMKNGLIYRNLKELNHDYVIANVSPEPENFSTSNKIYTRSSLINSEIECDLILTNKIEKNLESIQTDYNDHINKFKDHQIVTSTPKKGKSMLIRGPLLDENWSSECYDNTKKNILDDLHEKGDKDECFNATIDEAIMKYEKQEEKFKHVFVQTNFEESFSNNCCYCKNKYQKVSPRSTKKNHLSSPPIKKLKFKEEIVKENASFEKNEGELCESEIKSSKKENLSNYNTDSATKLLLTGSRIIKNETCCKPSKTPKIRVGLSKRARIGIKN